MAIVRAQDGSSSSTTCPFSYDVFLSFRGVDTRKNFTDHLYTALLQAGIRTFRDDDEIERGENLKPELEKAIKQSAVSIIVFSESYASSTWCLDELLAILESKNKSSNHEVIPVFYKVEPSDVRKQKRSFAEAFGQYDSQLEAETNQEKKKEWMKKVNAWREALTKSANLTGMVLADRHESKFIKEIVEAVEKKLNRRALYVAEHLVGRSDIIDRIDSSLRDGSSNVAIHVIYGIGGIGKTTIAKCIYNLHFSNFEASCFLYDVRETSNQPNGLLRLQTQLVSAIQKRQNEETIWNVAEGIIKVKHAICNKRVLIVLDDVTEMKQLEALLGPQEFYPGSKIILATRHKWLLSALRGGYEVHPIEKLHHHESLKLFSWYAFRQDHPEEAYCEQSKVIVDRCGGLPLALKVLGSSLFERTVDVWEDAMRKSEAIPNAGILKILQISYESLQDDKDKDLFLHIACFFIGEDRDYIVGILEYGDLYPVVGIQNLIDRCLLVIEESKLTMHQMIQEMGREIVRLESPKEPGKRSRLWHHEDSFDVLRENTGTEKIEGLVLDMNMLKNDKSTQSSNNIDTTGKGWYEKLFKRSLVSNWIKRFSCANEENLKIDALERMDNLLLLQLNYVRLVGSYQKFPKKLRWLCWHGFPSKSIPIGISLEKLVTLDMSYSKLQQIWKGFKLLKSLKILNLSYSEELGITPNFRGLPSLKTLILKGCVSLVELCESIISLKGLVLLDLEDCKSLRNIPSLPTSLVTLKMSSCQNLCGVGEVKWWPSLPRFLVTLSIEGCNLSDDSFPRDLSHLFSLKCLNVSKNSITTLPDCIINLSSIEKLCVNRCPKLKSIQALPVAVHELEIKKNTSLEEVKAVPITIISFDFFMSIKLYAVENCFKIVSIDKVDQKIIKNLGIESLSMEDVELDPEDRPKLSTEVQPIKVLYEFGIFSTYVPGRELPSCFMFKEAGSKISFRVPSHPGNYKIEGLNVCYTSLFEKRPPPWWTEMEVEVSNKTQGWKWLYKPTEFDIITPAYVWLSLWKCGDQLEVEDEVDVEIHWKCFKSSTLELCCINLVYEDEISEYEISEDEISENEISEEDKNEEAEKEESHHNGTYNHLAWTDKMFVELSDYNWSTGVTYCFTSNAYLFFRKMFDPGLVLVDWWGPKPSFYYRQINGSVLPYVKHGRNEDP